mgnify:CR=1 FL=1
MERHNASRLRTDLLNHHQSLLFQTHNKEQINNALLPRLSRICEAEIMLIACSLKNKLLQRRKGKKGNIKWMKKIL